MSTDAPVPTTPRASASATITSTGATLDEQADISLVDEALFHLALANLPADLRQQRIDALLDMRLECMAQA